MNKEKKKIITPNEVKSILSLFDDPDDKVFESLKTQILANPEVFYDEIMSFWDTEDKKLNARADSLIYEMHLSLCMKNLEKWKRSDQDDLLKGILIIESYFDIFNNMDDVRFNIDNLAEKVWLEINENLTSLEKIKMINYVLFKDYKFKIIPDKGVNDFGRLTTLSYIVDFKEIPSFSCAVLYYIIAQKLNIEIKFTDLQINNHPFLAHTDKYISEIVLDNKDNQVVFYIVPGLNGEVWSHRQAKEYISTNKVDNLYLSDIEMLSNIEIVKEYLVWKQINFKDDDEFTTENFDKLINILDK